MPVHWLHEAEFRVLRWTDEGRGGVVYCCPTKGKPYWSFTYWKTRATKQVDKLLTLGLIEKSDINGILTLIPTKRGRAVLTQQGRLPD